MKYDDSEIMIDTLNSLIDNDINDCAKDDVLFLINMIEKSKTCILSIEELEDMKKNGTRSWIKIWFTFRF